MSKTDDFLLVVVIAAFFVFVLRRDGSKASDAKAPPGWSKRTVGDAGTMYWYPDGQCVVVPNEGEPYKGTCPR